MVRRVGLSYRGLAVVAVKRSVIFDSDGLSVTDGAITRRGPVRRS